jgi:hypothetical protein
MAKSTEKVTDAATEARRAYKRKWNAAHKDKVKEYQKKYWERKAAELAKGEQ